MAARFRTAWLLALILPAATAAPPGASALLAQLAGKWDLAGTVMGKPAHYHAAGRWVLDGRWLEFSMTDVARPPAYQAQVYIGYDPKAGDYIAHWLDRFGAAGARVVGTGTGDAKTLVLLFPYPESAFRDTLTLGADRVSGTLVLEAQQPDHSWATFASYRMKRLAGAHAAGDPR